MGVRTEQTFFQRRNANAEQAHEKMLIITNHQGNASPDTYQNNSQQKRTQVTNVNKDVKKRELCNVGGNLNWYSHFGSFPQIYKTKNRTSI